MFECFDENGMSRKSRKFWLRITINSRETNIESVSKEALKARHFTVTVELALFFLSWIGGLKGATGGTSWSIEMLAQMSGNFKNFYFFRDFRGLKIKQIWKSFDFIHFHYSWKFIFWDFRSFSRNKSYLGIFGDPHPIPGKSIPIPKNPHPRGFFPKVTHPQSPSPSPGFGDGDRGSPKIPIPAASLPRTTRQKMKVNIWK